MTTSAHSSRRRVQLTLFAVDFPARTSPMPAPVLASVRAPGAGFSTSSCVSFAWWDRDSWSWRTSQRSLIEGWTSFSENWPKQGLMRNGLASRRVMWAPAISVIGGGALPTPKANSAMTVDLRTQQNRPELQPNLETVMARMLPTPAACVANDGERPETWLARRERVKAKGINGNGMGMPLTIAAQLLPTPTVNDAGNSTLPPSLRGRDSLPGQMLRDDSIPTGPGTHLNPSFVEEMMGFPVGWTA
jgi:hypothetical protein